MLCLSFQAVLLYILLLTYWHSFWLRPKFLLSIFLTVTTAKYFGYVEREKNDWRCLWAFVFLTDWLNQIPPSFIGDIRNKNSPLQPNLELDRYWLILTEWDGTEQQVLMQKLRNLVVVRLHVSSLRGYLWDNKSYQYKSPVPCSDELCKSIIPKSWCLFIFVLNN